MSPRIKFGITGIIIVLVIFLSFNVPAGNQLFHNTDSSVNVLRIGYFLNIIMHKQSLVLETEIFKKNSEILK